jgi:tRNA pseudouridine13 synthase
MTVRVLPIANPLPRHFLTDEPGVGGRIKQRPEDFIVEELPLYQPSGEGEHLYLGIEATNVSHADLLNVLRQRFNIAEKAIGYAGMKDKMGVTRQVISIHVPTHLADEQSLTVSHPRVRILWAERHVNKLRRGHLVGNRFSIRIREVDPTHVPRARRILETLDRTGVPTYFGQQRFGYRLNGHLLGAMLLHGDYQGILAELLGSTGTPFPEHQRERRELYDHGRHADALQMWTRSDRSERAAITALLRGWDARAACLAVGKTTWSFWVSAWQSVIFNRVVDQRIESGTLNRLIEGDLAWHHPVRKVFAVTAEELVRDELPARLAAFDVSPSGPLWGPGMTKAGRSVLQHELDVLHAAGGDLDLLASSRYSPEGARRPLREPLRNIGLEGGVDEHGGYIRVAFDLPRGVYATIVLREIMKRELTEPFEQA